LRRFDARRLGAGPRVAGLVAFAVFTVTVVGNIALTVWAVTDASSRSRVAFYVAGYNRTAWIVVLVTSFFVAVGFIPALVYLVGTRPKVAAAALRGY
jgi:hypothetical protein